MELVTGRAGSPHITSQQDRQKHQGIWGDGAYILATGNQLEPQVQSSNKILIKDGALMFQGALFSVKVGTTDEITINNGNQGMQRKDLVVARYTYDSAQQKESAEWVVIQGEPAASNPVAPSGTSGNIQEGDATVDCPFMIVNLDGINVTGVDIIPEVAPDIPTINASLSELRDNNYELGSDITSDHSIWYKKYANGLIEYWGRSSSPSSGAGGQGYATIDFPVPFKSVNDYILTAEAEYANSSMITFETSVQRNSASRAYIYTITNTGSVTGAWAQWTAKGFWK